MSTKKQITDLIGKQLENLSAILIKLGGKLDRFGVGHGLEVDGETYRYEFLLARQGTYEFDEMQKKGDSIEK